MLVEITSHFLKREMEFSSRIRSSELLPIYQMLSLTTSTLCSSSSFPFPSVLLVPLLLGPSEFLLTIGYKPLPVAATVLFGW